MLLTNPGPPHYFRDNMKYIPLTLILLLYYPTLPLRIETPDTYDRAYYGIILKHESGRYAIKRGWFIERGLKPSTYPKPYLLNK